MNLQPHHAARRDNSGALLRTEFMTIHDNPTRGAQYLESLAMVDNYLTALEGGWRDGVHDVRARGYQHPWLVVKKATQTAVGCRSRDEARKLWKRLRDEDDKHAVEDERDAIGEGSHAAPEGHEQAEANSGTTSSPDMS